MSNAAIPATVRATAWTRARRLTIGADAALGLGFAGDLTVLAFLTRGGVDLAPNTWVQIALTTTACALAAAVVLVGGPGRAWGGVALVLFAALAALTYASLAWSVQPSDSWLEANRTLSYLAAFAGAIALARLAPGRWPAVVSGIAVATTVLAGYALLAKVFPATFDASSSLGRLRVPFDYYNAAGLSAALGLPACVWAGARQESSRAARTLAVPAIAILVGVLVLSYGRSALGAAVVGLGCWFALVPLRLRGACLLALGVIGGAAIAAWALSHRALSHDYVALHARTSEGRTFGLFLVLVLVALTTAGFLAGSAMERLALSATARRRAGIGLVTAVALIPVGALAGFALSSRGLGGEVSHVWNALTNPNGSVGNGAGRLAELNNSRPRYWSEGLKVGEHALLAGTGAAGYVTAHTRYTTDPRHVGHAHSYAIETFADFGLIGIALNLALLAAWGIAAARPLRGPPDAPGVAGALTAERAGMLTLGAIVLIFGLHSLLDWTWFIPGTAIPALICAGWLAGRGPLPSPVGRVPLRASPAAAAAVIALAALALLAAWVIWQPLRSANADSDAIAAMVRGDTRAALADAHSAAAIDPVSVEPLWELSAIYGALGDRAAGRRELVKAVSLQPDNPATWEQLGAYELQQGRPRPALAALEHAARLDRTSAQLRVMIGQAQARLARR